MIEKDTIQYVISLLSAQTFVYAQEQLKNTKPPYYKADIKAKGNAFLTSIIQNLNKDISKLFKNDEIQAMELQRSIERIGKLIAEGNGEALTIIDQMLQKGFDFSKYKLVEI